MSGTSNSTVNVGPTAEYMNARYGDAVPTSASRHLEPRQFQAFPPKIATASDDNGWIGPLGFYTMHSNAGSLYGYGTASTQNGKIGYGVPQDNPQY